MNNPSEIYPVANDEVDDSESQEEIPQIEHDFSHFDALDMEKAKRYFDYLQRRISDPTRYIDKGGAGSVFNINNTVCIKMMEDKFLREEMRAREIGREPYHLDLGNRPVVEARIQEHVANLSVAGVRAPHITQYIPGKFWHGIVMERLSAVNMQHCLSGTVPFPEHFDSGVYMDALGEYLNALHSEKLVYHGDLEPRNVMIDVETGSPYMIDFGRSGTLVEGERSVHADGDWQKYDALYEKLEKV